MSQPNDFSGYSKMTRPMVVRELPISVYVTEFGDFVADLGEDWLKAPSYYELKALVEKTVAERATQISIPFAIFTLRTGFRKGTIRGIHGGNGDFLVTWENGEKDRLSKMTDSFCEMPAPEIEANANRIRKEIDDLVAEGKKIDANVPKLKGKDMADKVLKAMGREFKNAK